MADSEIPELVEVIPDSSSVYVCSFILFYFLLKLTFDLKEAILFKKMKN